MGNFNKFDKSRNRGGGGYNRSGSDRGGSFGGRKQMFPANCGDCGKDCEVPFRPTGKFPVYCNNCFKNQGNSQSRSSGKSFGGGRGDRSSGRNSDRPATSGGNTITKAQFDSITSKLDKIVTLLTLTQKEESEKKKAKKTAVKKTKVKEKKVRGKAPKKIKKKTVKKAKVPVKKKKAVTKKAKKKK